MHLEEAQAEFDEWDDDTDIHVDAARRAVRDTWDSLGDHRPEVLLGSLHFAGGSSDIAPEQTRALDEAIGILALENDTTVMIAGHASSAGSMHFNYHLSERRAEAVAQYFMDHEIAPSRITTSPQGEFHPLASNQTRSGRAENQRVAFRVMRTYPIGYRDRNELLDPPPDYAFPSKPNLDPDPEDEYLDKIRKKFARGTCNTSSGWIEIPKDFSQEVAERDLLTGSGYGLGQGVARGVLRTAVGLFELGTFFIPRHEAWITRDPDVLDLRHIF
jgi:putative exosortase-associated protein (TIGR04073 family)